MKSFVVMFLSIIMLLAFASVGGASFKKVGFGAMSTASGANNVSTSCAVLGGLPAVIAPTGPAPLGANLVNAPINMMNPIPGNARVFNLHKAGFANYSAHDLGNTMVDISCFQTAAPQTPVSVHLYFDGVDSNFPITNKTLYISPQ